MATRPRQALIRAAHVHGATEAIGRRMQDGDARIASALKMAVIEGAARTGWDGTGDRGLVGYLQRLATCEPRAYASLLGRVISSGDDPVSDVVEAEEQPLEVRFVHADAPAEPESDA